MTARGRRIGGVLAILAISGLVLACFGRLVAHPDHLVVDGDRPSIDDFQKIEPRQVGNDLTQLFLPQHSRISAEIARGRWPSAWDSGGFGGRPRVGNPQAGLFYPPIWLAWLSGRPSTLGWLTVAHLIAAGFGVFTLSRRFGSGLFASMIASGAYAASPYVLAQVFEGHYPHVWGACWSPWAFLAADGLRRGDLRGTLALPPILAMAAMTGHPQEAFYLAIAIGAWLVGDAIRKVRRGESRKALVSMASWGVVVATAAGLAAVEVIPVAEAASWGRKADRLTILEASKYHVDLLNLVQLLSPDALGGPADYFGHDNYWETVLSIGFVPLVLALIGRRRARGWSLLAILAVAFAAGWRLGLFAILYELVPGMDRFRVPARSLFLASLAGAMLVGQGIERLREPIPEGIPTADWRRLRRLGFVLAIALGLGQGAAWLWGLEDRPRESRPSISAKADRRPRANHDREIGRWAMSASRILHQPAAWMALGGTALALAWLRVRPVDGRKVAIGLGALAWLELAWYGSTLLKTATPDQFLGPDPVAEAIASCHPDRPFRIRARDPFYSDLRAQSAGLEKTNLNDAFQVGRAADLYEVLYPIFGPFRSIVDQGAMAEVVREYRRDIRQAVLDRLGVAFLVSDKPVPEASWPVAASGTWNQRRFLIYRNPTALPRAYVVPRAVATVDDAALNTFLYVSPKDAVLMASDPLRNQGPRQPFTAAKYDSSEPDRVVVSVETASPGLLVVADTWMPGWAATLDGKPVEIRVGNHAQRVIALPRAGRHRVVMEYEPPGFRMGLMLTAISGLFWSIAAAAMVVRGSEIRALVPSRVRSRKPGGYSRPSRTFAGYSRSS